MGPVYFMLAIMGCGDGTTGCQQARVEPARYATIQQCRAAMPAALARNTDVDAPVISASCERVGWQMTDATPMKKRG